MDKRIDHSTGREVVIVGARQGRPNLPSTDCPFCPGGLEAPDDYDVRWFKNRWPALGDDRCEVVLYSPVHDAALWELPHDQVVSLIGLWAERFDALAARPDVAYVLIFENRGPEVGATIAHPHGQIYAYPDVPPAPRRELEQGSDVDPAGVTPDLMVAHNATWAAWVPEAAWWPYELVLAPKSPIPTISDPMLVRADLAQSLIDATARLDQLFDAPMPYMMWWHQRPTDGGDWPGYRLHLHITPLWRAGHTPRYAAAAELGAEVYFNPVDPAAAADRLRSLPGRDRP